MTEWLIRDACASIRNPRPPKAHMRRQDMHAMHDIPFTVLLPSLEVPDPRCMGAGGWFRTAAPDSAATARIVYNKHRSKVNQQLR